MELKKKVFEGVKWFSLGQLVSNVLSLIRMPIIAYFIVPSEYGVMSIIYMLITFGTIFSDSGIGKAWIQKQTNSLVVFSTVFWLNIFVCLIIYSFFFLSRNLVSSLFNDIQLVTLIPYASLGIVFSSIGQQYSFFLDKELKFKEKAIINLTTSIIGFLLLITLLILGYKLWAIIITNLAISLLKSFLFFIVGYRLFAARTINGK
jgi:O-antigen/teichoic acid export membrane protein